LTGSTTSLLQLIIASIFISHDPSGIIANPVKLGLSLVTILMDGVFVWQRYGLYGVPVEAVESIDEGEDAQS
jgi:cystinosin